MTVEVHERLRVYKEQVEKGSLQGAIVAPIAPPAQTDNVVGKGKGQKVDKAAHKGGKAQGMPAPKKPRK